jgi:hypothetical protein
MVVGSVSVLPRVLVHRTPFGTRVERQQGSGLLARDAAGWCRSLTPEELRRQFPEAWPAWARLAALLLAGEAAPPLPSQIPGGEIWVGARLSSPQPATRIPVWLISRTEPPFWAEHPR